MTALPGRPSKGRIVVGVDGSESSKEALRWAARQGEMTGATLELLMTWEIPPAAYGYPVPMPTGYDLSNESERELQNVIQEIRADFPSIDLERKVIEGRAGPALVAAADGADLLVVGNRGHGAVVGMLLGSVSEYCITHASCPVVVVRHRKEAAVGEGKRVGSAAH